MFPPVPGGEPPPCVKRGEDRQTDTWAPRPVPMEKEPCSWSCLGPRTPPATADRKRWLPSATTGCEDIFPLSQAGFRQVSVQHLRICPGDKQQHYWRGAGHVSGEEESGTSLTTEPQQPHTQANGSETRQ